MKTSTNPANDAPSPRSRRLSAYWRNAGIRALTVVDMHCLSDHIAGTDGVGTTTYEGGNRPPVTVNSQMLVD